MTPALAAGIVRFIVASQLKERAREAGHGKVWRKLHGMTRKELTKKRVLMGNDNAGPVPASDGHDECYVGFWCLLNKPTTSKDVIIREAKGVVLAHLGAQAGGAMGRAGGAVAQINEVRSGLSGGGDAAKIGAAAVSKDVRAQIANGIYNQLNEAWRAGIWDCVAGTRNEFAFALDEAMTGGACCFSGPQNNLKIGMRMWPDKRDLVSFMGYAEQKGLNSLAARKYVRDLCTETVWSYSARNQALTQMA